MELNPLVVVWEYTLACNSKCIHCGSRAGKPRKSELSSLECLDLVDQLADLGFKRVILSGGEPTLREDWSETGKKIVERGMDLGIISNMLAWEKGTYDTLDSIRPWGIGFSVDGEEKLHDYIRGIEGSHKKVFSSVRELKRRGHAVCGITSVSKINLPELEKIRNRLYVHQVDSWQIQTISPMGNLDGCFEFVLDNDDHYKLAEFIAETSDMIPWMRVRGGDCIGYFGKLEDKLYRGGWDGCSAGIKTVGIDSNGIVRGCLSIRDDKAIAGDIRKEKLAHIWNDDSRWFNRNFKIENLGENCKGCQYGEKCKGGCQCQSLSFSGKLHNSPYCLYRHENGGTAQ